MAASASLGGGITITLPRAVFELCRHTAVGSKGAHRVRDPRSNAPLSIPYSGVRLCRSRAEHPSPPVKTNEAYMIMKSHSLVQNHRRAAPAHRMSAERIGLQMSRTRSSKTACTSAHSRAVRCNLSGKVPGGWATCGVGGSFTSSLSPPALRLSKHQLRGGLETSFQKSKITRGAVTPSAQMRSFVSVQKNGWTSPPKDPDTPLPRLRSSAPAQKAKMRKAPGRQPSITTSPHRCSR